MSDHTDLPLNADPASRFLPWIIGLLIYLASLSIVVGLSVDTLTTQWTQGLKDMIILEMPLASDHTSEDERLETEFKIFQLIQSTPGLGSIKPLSFKDALEQLGTHTFSDEDLKLLPKLLEIQVTNRSNFSLTSFKRNLATLSPHIHAEDHEDTKNGMHKIAQSTQMVSFGIVSMIILATIAIIAFTSQTSLIIHRNVIEILYLVGGTRSYISRQFQSHALRIGIRGSLISLVLGAFTFLSISLFGSHILFLDQLMKMSSITLVFGLTSLVITLFIMISARLSVKIALNNGL
jgi:cell division transport system permease protein